MLFENKCMAWKKGGIIKKEELSKIMSVPNIYKTIKTAACVR